MNATTFVTYLKECLVPELKRGDVVMMDNLPVHRVAAVREVIEAAGAKLRYLPKYSPDLNPIEHLWQHLKRQLASYETEPAGIHELWERVQTELDKIPVQVCTELIESMPRRVDAVLKAKGGYTKY
jgi:transposase